LPPAGRFGTLPALTDLPEIWWRDPGSGRERRLSQLLARMRASPVAMRYHVAIARLEQERSMIHAECHTADEAMRAEFDATPWFESADSRAIILLAKRGWSAPWVADALEVRSGYEALRELIRYARDRLEMETREDPSWPTFECRVDGAGATAWLDRNRPDIAAEIRGCMERGEFAGSAAGAYSGPGNIKRNQNPI
jgi:hypothetical protein